MTAYRTNTAPPLVRVPTWRRFQHRLAHRLRVHACHLEHHIDHDTGEPHEWIWVVCDTCGSRRPLAHSAACTCNGPNDFRHVNILDPEDLPSMNYEDRRNGVFREYLDKGWS